MPDDPQHDPLKKDPSTFEEVDQSPEQTDWQDFQDHCLLEEDLIRARMPHHGETAEDRHR